MSCFLFHIDIIILVYRVVVHCTRIHTHTHTHTHAVTYSESIISWQTKRHISNITYKAYTFLQDTQTVSSQCTEAKL